MGGGTAGCVLANRLSEDKSKNILVLEVRTPTRLGFDQAYPSSAPPTRARNLAELAELARTLVDSLRTLCVKRLR